MALSAFVGAFGTTTGVATTTVAVTGVGFQPTAVIFWWSGNGSAVDNFSGGNIRRGIGVATSSTSRWAVGSVSVDAQATSMTDRIQREDACIAIQTVAGAGTVDGLMDFVSMDADGFTMIIDDAFIASFRIHYLALGGADITNVSTGRFDEPAATGNQDTTSAGFQPDFVLFGSTGLNTDPPSISATAQLMVGAAVSSSQQAVLNNLSLDAQATTDTDAYSLAGECIAFGSGPTGRATFDSFLSNGFRLNWLERTSDRITFYLAMKGGSYRVNDFLTSTSAAATVAETGFGFVPRGTLLVSHGRAADTANAQSASDQWNVGAFTSTSNRGAQGVLDEDAVADSDNERYVEHDIALGQITTAPAFVGELDVQSIDADGFTMVMDTAANPAAFVWYVSFGDTPGAAAENPYPYIGGGYYPTEG